MYIIEDGEQQYVIGIAYYVRWRALKLRFVLNIVEDRLHKYCTPYFTLWKTEVIDTVLVISNFERGRVVIPQSVLHIVEFYILYINITVLRIMEVQV